MPDISIEDIPELPKAVLDAYDRGKVIFFIGAGISRLQNLPGWDQLANQLISAAFLPAECKQIQSSITDNKQLITIAYHHLVKQGEEKKFFSIFNQCLKPTKRKNKDKRDIYALLFQLRALFVTTNCDGLLEKKIGEHCCTTECTTTKLAQAKPQFLFYLHGRYVSKNEEDKASLVFTSDQYLKKYSDPDFKDFLYDLFEKYTVVFLGYGMNEFELLENLLRKADADLDKRHYILEGFFGYEEALADAMSKYYEVLNVKLLAYKMDDKKFRQQYDVIQHWIEQLKVKTNYSTKQILDIAVKINDPTPTHKQQLLKEINRDTAQIFIPEIYTQINQSKQCLFWVQYFFEIGLYNIKLDQRQSDKDNGSHDSYNKLLDGLNILIRKQPLDKKLHQLCGQILQRIFEEFVVLPENSQLRKNFELLRTLCDILGNLRAEFVPANIMQFIKSMNSNYHKLLMSALSHSEQFIKWKKEPFKSTFQELYCLPLLDYHTDQSYYAQRFFIANKARLTKVRSKLILSLIKHTIKTHSESVRYYLFILTIEGATFNQPDRSLYRPIMICLDVLKPKDVKAFVYRGINSFRSSPFLCKMCIYILGKQPQIPLIIEDVHINPWSSSSIKYEWLQCILRRSAELSSDDFFVLMHWIEESGHNNKSISVKEEETHINYRKWQIAELAHHQHPEFTQIMQALQSTFKDDNGLLTIAQELDHEHNDILSKKQQDLEAFGRKILPMDEPQMINTFRQSYPTQTEYEKREVSELIAAWVKDKLRKGDKDLKFYTEIPMDINEQVFWNLTNFAVNEAKEAFALFQLAFGFVEYISGAQLITTPSAESAIRACFHILEKLLPLDSHHADQTYALCLKYIKLFDSDIDSSAPTYLSINDVLNDVQGCLYSLYWSCLAVLAKRKKQPPYISSEDKNLILNVIVKNPHTPLRYVLAMHLRHLYILDRSWGKSILNTILGNDSHTIALVSIATGLSSLVIPELTRYIVDHKLLIPWDKKKEDADKANNLRLSLFAYMGNAFFYQQLTTAEVTALLEAAPANKVSEFISGISLDIQTDFDPNMLAQCISQIYTIIEGLSKTEAEKKGFYSALIRIIGAKKGLTDEVVKVCTKCIPLCGDCYINYDEDLIEEHPNVNISTWFDYYKTLVEHAKCWLHLEEIRKITTAFLTGGIERDAVREFLNKAHQNEKISGATLTTLFQEFGFDSK